jgi:hypothetical protein
VLFLLFRNYDSEIYSFGKRLGEEFDEEILRKAFCDECVSLNLENKKLFLHLLIFRSFPDTDGNNQEMAAEGKA